MSKRKGETWSEYHLRRKESGYNYFKQNQEKVQEKQRQKRAKNGGADDAKYYARHKEEIRAKLYGLTLDELISLGDKCEVCGDTERLCVDHNHFTGQVRGLLCNRCNAALGMLGDSKDNIINLLNYLTRANS
jgi:hypothetical protein